MKYIIALLCFFLSINILVSQTNGPPLGNGTITSIAYNTTTGVFTVTENGINFTTTVPVITVSAGTGITVNQTGNNYQIVNNNPDQTVSLTGSSNIVVTGSYPNFTLSASGLATSGANTNISSVYLNNNGLKIKDSDASHGLTVSYNTNITADRLLNLLTGDYNSTIDLSGTSDGQVLKWNNTTKTWAAGVDAGAGGATLGDGDYGDISVTGGGTMLTIDNGVVTFAKMQNITNQRLLGNNSGASGSPTEISVSSGLGWSGNTIINLGDTNAGDDVTLSTTQTISGQKTFSINPILSAGLNAIVNISQLQFSNAGTTYSDIQSVNGSTTSDPTLLWIVGSGTGSETLYLRKNKIGINGSPTTRPLEIFGSSPLRFINLTSSTSNQTGTLKMLTVDAFGDVGVNTIPTGGGGSSFYQLIKNNGTSVAQQPNLNLVPTSDITLTGTDDNVNTETEITANLTTTGVTASTYGSATQSPVITVDSKGRITLASNTTINSFFNTDQTATGVRAHLFTDNNAASLQLGSTGKTAIFTLKTTDNSEGIVIDNYTDTKNFKLSRGSGQLQGVTRFTAAGNPIILADEDRTLRYFINQTNADRTMTPDAGITLDGGSSLFFPNKSAYLMQMNGTDFEVLASHIPLTVQDEGTNLQTTVNKINFTGSGVTASTPANGTITVNISGGGGGSVPLISYVQKSADQNITVTTQTNITDFSFTATSGSKYRITVKYLYTASPATVSPIFDISHPGGNRINSVSFVNNVATPYCRKVTNYNARANVGTITTSGGINLNSSLNYALDYECYYDCTTNGTVNITIQPAVTNGINILQNSIMIVEKLN